MRPIDADALIAEYDRVHIGPAGGARKLMEDAPTLDVAPVVHGWWTIECDDFDCELMRCSVCGAEYYNGDNDTVDMLPNYCPNCGARMDGDTDV